MNSPDRDSAVRKAPQLRYFLSENLISVCEDGELWKNPLPLHRNPSKRSFAPPFTYGDYFTGTQAFLEKDAYRLLTEAISRRLERRMGPSEIEGIDIRLAKHGEFYHPARVVVRAGGHSIPLVLNVALSKAGRDCSKREHALLKRLRTAFPWPFLPDVYGHAEGDFGETHEKVGMFLGEWFEGYCEFHISGFQSDGSASIAVWDPVKGAFGLPQQSVLPLFEQAAAILTCYFSLDTFEQIFPWSHAAGDFVVRLHDGTPDVKLISVRRYGSLVDGTATDLKTMIHALLVFFLNLAIRMRMDRLDGVGELVWADERAVAGALKGFFDGLERKASTDPLAEPVSVIFKEYLLSCTEADLYEISKTILERCLPESPETGLARKHLNRHVSELFHEIRSVNF